MFNDERFVSKCTVDKRGRPQNFTSKENYRKYYDLKGSDESESEDDDDDVEEEEESEDDSRSSEDENDRDETQEKSESESDEAVQVNLEPTVKVELSALFGYI